MWYPGNFCGAFTNVCVWQGEGNMLLWETDSPIEKRDRRGRLVKWEYMVMYRAAHSGVIFGDSGPAVSKPLGFIGDWALTWESESVVNLMLGQCKYAAMKTHKRLQAEEEMECVTVSFITFES